MAGLGLVVVATCVTGCEPANDFSITNATNQPLTVQKRHQHPGAAPSPLNPGDWKATLQPGQKLPFGQSLLGAILGYRRANRAAARCRAWPTLRTLTLTHKDLRGAVSGTLRTPRRPVAAGLLCRRVCDLRRPALTDPMAAISIR